jgi:hypothetical protein
MKIFDVIRPALAYFPLALCMDNLLQNETFLIFNLLLLKVLSWLAGGYFLAFGMLKFKKAWKTESKKDLFIANICLLPGILLALLFFKLFL